MEITCTRCHQAVEVDSCYCPTCGLPQLVYTTEVAAGPAPQEKWNEAAGDASVVEWKRALRVAFLLAVPAGLLSSDVSLAGGLGLFWMVAAAAWAVTIYVRSQRPAWITTGAGARIGVVTGLLAAALAFSITGIWFFLGRSVLHQGGAIDAQWRAFVDYEINLIQQIRSQMGIQDQGQIVAQKALMLSPEVHAGIMAFSIAGRELFFVLCAAAGGAIGARVLARSKRTQG
jgi:hypothetical protein